MDASPTVHLKALSTFRLASMPLAEYTDRCRARLRGLKPRPAVAEKVLNVPPDAVGIHVRRGDSWRSIRYSPLRLFIDQMRRHLADDPAGRFYLASDSPRVHEVLHERFGDKVISYPKRDYRRATNDGVEDALVDLLCLARTRRLYGSYMSSFSSMAAELSGAPYETLRVRGAPHGWDEHAIDRWHGPLMRWDEDRQRWRAMRGGWFRFRPDHLVLRGVTAYVTSPYYQMRRHVPGSTDDRDAQRLFGGPNIVFDDGDSYNVVDARVRPASTHL